VDSGIARNVVFMTRLLQLSIKKGEADGSDLILKRGLESIAGYATAAWTAVTAPDAPKK